MNQESLSHIAKQKESLNADTVLDLVQMCQTFPYFHVPYVVLSKHYQSKNDFRTENTLFQAALRTPDRAWLFDYISGNNFTQPTVDEIVPQPAQIEVQPDTIAITEIQTTQPLIVEEPFQTEEKTVIESIDSKVETTDIPINANEILVVESTVISEVANIQSTETPFEFNKEPILEIVSFNEPDNIEPETIEPAFDKEPESMLFVPSIEPEVEIETTDLEVEKTNRTWLFDPEIAEDEPLSEENHDHSNTAKTQTLAFGVGYNIEDYFKLEPQTEPIELTASEHPMENNDFFSWLNSGIANQGPINKPTQQSTVNLIDKFIQENPSIQRPKKEFFSPERAMKKSEVLDMGIVTETLANIYTVQGYPEKAIKVYEQLQLKFPEKLSYFASLIQKLKLEHNL